ncbi:hypothetical protein B0I35DRAFT_484739 [Stachybotrys elegans]|uniref:Rhodopsin domain-containing protein n=1 Tax=Stachybotrys elegans TaxID=80388 RepID=A0A8K0SEU4_9HYPO|nr:hypothetical protein B0I35DRAFT_484739 [Stachybotrys elegans]
MSAFATESWTWYGITWVVVLARMTSRILLQGSIFKLQADDALMMLAMVCDTVLMVSINIVATTSSNLIDPNDHAELTPENIKTREFGSKMVLVTEQMQIITIWTVKACLLLMYNRLTMSLRQNLAVKIVAGYTVVSLVVMEILYLGVWCRPFEQYWAVPPDNVQCSAATNHLITNTVFNISSDILIILIPMPIFLQSRIDLKKKFILCSVFALGGFTILCAILNKYYSFTMPFGSEWTAWYVRESSTALITANLPMTWTLFRRMFNLRSFAGSSNDRYGTRTTSRFQSLGRSKNNRSAAQSAMRSTHRPDGKEVDPADSQEEINRQYGIPLRIYQKNEVEVRSSPANNDDGRSSSSLSIHEGVVTTVVGGSRAKDSNAETSSERSTAGIVRVTSF